MLNPVETNRYISIKSDGLFHEVVPQDREGSVYREYELKDGTKGGKWELLYKDISNVTIKNIKFEDSDYGENILTTFTDGENEVIWSENTGTNFASDWMKRLPRIDFTAKVSIKPYAFTDDRGKSKKGVSVYQSDKVDDYFYDWEKREELHGFPKVPKDREEMKTDDWKLHFLQVKMFLTEYVKKNILTKFEVSPEKSDSLDDYGLPKSAYPTAESEGLDLSASPF